MRSRKLRSINKELLVVPKYNLETYGKRAFSVTSNCTYTVEKLTRLHQNRTACLSTCVAVPFRSLLPFICLYISKSSY